MSTVDDLIADEARIVKAIRPALQKSIPNTADFDLLDKPQVVKFTGFPIGLVYFPFYGWLAAHDPTLISFNKAPADSIRAFLENKRDFLGSGTKRSVLDVLAEIAKWPPGNALLLAIKVQTKKLRITPDFVTIRSGLSEVGGVPDILQQATSTAMPIYDEAGNVVPMGGGLGSGSDYQLAYSPELYGRAGSMGFPEFPGGEPDEILFHELVHALRALSGHTYMMPVNQNYRNEDEYLAVVLTNIYMSSSGKTKLRDAWAGPGGVGVPGELKSPEKFLDNVQQVNLEPRMLLERFRLSQQTFFDALAKITPTGAAGSTAIGKFNPVRDYADELKSGKAKAGRKTSP